MGGRCALIRVMKGWEGRCTWWILGISWIIRLNEAQKKNGGALGGDASFDSTFKNYPTLILRGLLSSRLLRVMCSTPSLNLASTFFSSTVGGRVKLRRKRW